MSWCRVGSVHASTRPCHVLRLTHSLRTWQFIAHRAICNETAARSSNTRSSNHSRIGRNVSLKESPPTESEVISIAGITRSIRKQKKVAFAHISDGSTLEPIQAILDPSQAKDITNGTYVELSGNWKPSPGRGQAYELHVTAVNDIGEAVPDEYPIQKKSQTVEYLRSLPHLRMRTPLHSLIARTRSQLISASHEFYTSVRPAGSAVQVHPPLITSSDCEGAGEVFTITPKIGGQVLKDQDTQSQLYFKGNKYLTVSSQLHLEAYAAELGDVWTLSPTFRAEESDTPRHLSEFYMLEAEFRSVKTLQDVMTEAQQLLQHLVSNLANSTAGKDLLAYHADPKYVTADDESQAAVQERWQRALSPNWPQISYKDAIAILEKHSAANPDKFIHPIRYENGLQLEHERFLVAEFANGNPLFVTNYPKSIKPFYMLPSNAVDRDATDETVACFDLLFPFGTAEIIGGSLREHRLPNLIETMRQKGLVKSKATAGPSPQTGTESEHPGSHAAISAYPFLRPGETMGSMEWYADLRRYGTSPHGGFGMGFDRLIAYVAGISSIRDTVGFPRYFGRADC